MSHNHAPEAITGTGVLIGFSEFMDFLSWMGEHADGLGILFSIIGVLGGLWLQRQRNKILERQGKKK